MNRDLDLTGAARLLKNGTVLIDGDGNVDMPVTTTNLTTSGNTTLGDASGDSLTINATTTASAPITVGVNDTGHDVKFFGATSGKSLLWDESADKLIVTGDLTVTGVTQQTGALTVGVDATGHDVKIFGDTTAKFMVWDQSADDLILADAVALQLGGDESTADGFKLEFDGTDTLALNALTANDKFSVGATVDTDTVLNGANGSVTLDASADTLAIAGLPTTLTTTLTVGVDDTGHDVKLFGATAGKSLLWDESADTLIVTGAASVTDLTTLKGATAVPATAGAVAAGVPVSMYSTGITIEVTSDAPTHTRPKGSICINTGGSSTSTRLYINTDGAGTWASCTTSA